MLSCAPVLVALCGMSAAGAVNIDNEGVFASMLEEMQHDNVAHLQSAYDEPADEVVDIGEAPQIGNVKGASTVKWSQDSGLRFELEALIALLWISMVASLPLIIIKFHGKDITKTQLVTFAVMWLVYFGGCWVFMNLVLFQSVHFDRVRPLNLIEAVYLLAQILTTVGYGDITPAKVRGQVFIGIYVLFSLCVIANVLGEVADLVAEQGKKFAAKLREQLKLALQEGGACLNDTGAVVTFSSADPEGAEQTFSSKWASFTSNVEPVPLDFKPLLGSICVYLCFVLMGCLFFRFYPGEGKTIFQGIYMSIITLSTVGFGAFTPVTRGGLVFGAFWMTFGSLALVGVVSNFASLVNQMAIRERWTMEVVKKQQLEFLEAFPPKANRADFLRRSLLHKGLVDQAELDSIEQFFNELNPDEADTVSKDALQNFMVQKGKMQLPA